jgi:predicted Zn-dependent peptidase
MNPSAQRSPWSRAFRSLGLAALLCLAAAPAASNADAGESNDPKVPFEKYTLDNGLEVILAQDRSVPLVAVNVWYHVGSGYETFGKSGFAHLFEHMMFQGSKNVGNDRHFEILKKAGVSDVNGTTNADRTNYYEVVPSNQLELALWLESDRMGHLLETLTDDSLKNQIDVVRNERRQRYDNVPYGKTRFVVAAAMYPEGHPYRYLTIGRHEDLESATLEDVKNFYRSWYVPANATLTVVGDFELADARGLIKRWFGSFPASKKPAVVPIPAPSPRAVTHELTDEFAKLKQVSWTWHSPGNFQPGDAELDLAADALSREGTGRLYRILVVEKQLAQSVMAYQYGSSFSGMFAISVTLRSGADLAEVKRIVDAEVARLRTEPVSDRELARSVTAIEAAAVYRMESLMARAEQLQAFNHYLGNPDSLTYDLDRYRKTTGARIRDAVSKHLTPDGAVVVVTAPAQGAKP